MPPPARECFVVSRVSFAFLKDVEAADEGVEMDAGFEFGSGFAKAGNSREGVGLKRLDELADVANVDVEGVAGAEVGGASASTIVMGIRRRLGAGSLELPARAGGVTSTSFFLVMGGQGNP
jgi:hypothetical protein